jgi:hypothetical protein
MFHDIAHDPGLARNPLLIRPADLAALRKKGWTRMPVDANGPYGPWGHLSGMLVNPAVHGSLIGHALRVERLFSREGIDEAAKWLMSLRSPSMGRMKIAPNLAWLAKSTGTVKRLWTIYNAASQARNIGSNFVQMHAFGGVPLAFVPMAYAMGLMNVIHKSAFFRLIEERMPSLANPMVAAELRAEIKAGRSLAEMGPIRRGMEKVAKGAETWWQMNEAAAKVGVVAWQMKMGKSMEEACAIAERALYHYGDVPRWVEISRTYGPIPFPTYALKTITEFSHTILTHPERINLWTRIGQEWEQAQGGDPEAERQLLPDYEQQNMPVLLHRGKNGQNLWMRAGYTLPWGAVAAGDMVAGPAKGEVLPAVQPLFDLSRGTDPLGNAITTPGAGSWQTKREQAEYLVKSYIPYGRQATRFLKWKASGAKARESQPSIGSQVASLMGFSGFTKSLPTEAQQAAGRIKKKSADLSLWVKRTAEQSAPLTPESRARIKKHVAEVRDEIARDWGRFGQLVRRAKMTPPPEVAASIKADLDTTTQLLDQLGNTP